MYDAYLDFFETAERKRRWNLFDDVPWSELNPAQNSERKATRIETYCAEEMYLPDYASHGARMTRELYGASCFQARWSFEESRHGLVFREYLIRSGSRSDDEIASLERMVFARDWIPPYPTVRQMSCYGALQEAAAVDHVVHVLVEELQDFRREVAGFADRFVVGHVGSRVKVLLPVGAVKG